MGFQQKAVSIFFIYLALSIDPIQAARVKSARGTIEKATDAMDLVKEMQAALLENHMETLFIQNASHLYIGESWATCPQRKEDFERRSAAVKERYEEAMADGTLSTIEAGWVMLKARKMAVTVSTAVKQGCEWAHNASSVDMSVLGQLMNQTGQSVPCREKAWAMMAKAGDKPSIKDITKAFGVLFSSDCKVHKEEACKNDQAFVDEKGYTCADWKVHHDCSAAVDKYAYSQEGQSAVLASCPKSCGTCDKACTDDRSFIDERGYSCHHWEGHDCSMAEEQYGYSGKGEHDIKFKCARVCGTCGKAVEESDLSEGELIGAEETQEKEAGELAQELEKQQAGVDEEHTEAMASLMERVATMTETNVALTIAGLLHIIVGMVVAVLVCMVALALWALLLGFIYCLLRHVLAILLRILDIHEFDDRFGHCADRWIHWAKNEGNKDDMVKLGAALCTLTTIIGTPIAGINGNGVLWFNTNWGHHGYYWRYHHYGHWYVR